MSVERKSQRFWRMVKIAQADQGWTDDDLAEALGWDRSSLSRKKNGSRSTSVDDMEAVEAVLPVVRVEVGLDVSALTDNRQYHRSSTVLTGLGGQAS